MAQAHGLYVGVPQHVPGEHGHGVGVIQEQGVGAHLLHIPGEVVHHRDGAQGPHNAPDAQGVGDGLAQAVLFGHLKVDDGAGVVQPHLDGVHHEIRPPQGVLPVLHPQVGGDFRVAPHGLVHGADDLRALRQPGAVNVVQGEFRLPQYRAAQAVPQHVPGKDGAARPHKSDLFHKSMFLSASAAWKQPPCYPHYTGLAPDYNTGILHKIPPGFPAPPP